MNAKVDSTLNEIKIEERVKSLIGSQVIQITLLGVRIEELQQKLEAAQKTITDLVEKVESNKLPA